MWGSAKTQHIASLEKELERERARFDALLDRYHEMRMQGAIMPRTPSAARPSNGILDTDDIALNGAKLEVIDKMVSDWVKRGHDPIAARTEAERIVGNIYEETS